MPSSLASASIPPRLVVVDSTAPAVPVVAALLARAFEASPQAATLVDVRDPAQPLVWVNHAFELLTGYPRGEIIGRNCRLLQPVDIDPQLRQRIREAVRQGERVVLTLPNRRRDGSRFVNTLQLEPLHDEHGMLTHYVGLQTKVGEPARRGPGDGQPAHTVLADRIEQALARASSIGTRCALLLLAVSPGTDGAPLPLHEVAATLGEAVADAAVSLTLLGDGELALLVDPAPDAGGVAALAQDCLDAVGTRLTAAGHGRACTVGIALGPVDGASAHTLLMAARSALERARLRAPDGGLAFFAHIQDADWLARRRLEGDLALAIRQRQFSLVYQPLVQLDNGRIAGFEALLRWTHPLRGAVSPAEFIPVAEASGMIDEIGDWVLGQALGQLSVFDRSCARPLRMAVNVSASQLAKPGFVDAVRAHLQRHAIAPGRLELEVTERTVTGADPVTVQTLAGLRRLGVKLAIDDFGTGYSNLHGLTRLPVDTLKIDMSLTQAVTQSDAAAAISRMVCELARALGAQVVVEGIETAAQLNDFRRFGAQFGQGWLLSRPLTADAAVGLLAQAPRLAPAAPGADDAHLLLVDDEPNILAALKRALRREGWTVHATSCPREALEILAAQPVGVVVSDQRMPEMPGTQFLRHVRQQHPHTVRMLLSGYSEIGVVTQAINEGAVWKFLAKPWDDDALREQIRLAFVEHRALRDAARAHAQALRRGDELQARVTRHEAQLELEARALAAARDVLLEMPVPVLGVGPDGIVVFSNAEADRVLGGGAPLIGRVGAEALPAGTVLSAGGWPYAVHTRPLSSDGASAGELICLVPQGHA